jgi:hypothetical protein
VKSNNPPATPSPSPPLVLALPAGARVATFTDGCRDAALDFINRVSVRADKQELADWLRGPYRGHVVAIGRTSMRRMNAASVLPGALEKLLARTRFEVMLGLSRAIDAADGVSFGFDALSSGLVYRCQDADRTPGWVPVSHLRMRLTDRVLSLVAADYLLRSEDYEQALFTCSACGLVAFDAQAKARGGICRSHARNSDIRELAPAPSIAALAG